MSDIVWNEAQRRVIEAPVSARLVVDAGPGTGKTATAAGRALSLLREGVAPERLWMIGFARAAVAEMRQRLVSLGGADTALPRVATLDSLAWRLRGGDPEGDNFDCEGYDAAIAETLAALRRRDPHMLAALGAVDHLIVDEAQDLVGNRALLAIALAERLRPSCGVTLLTDEAQAIYDFAGGAAEMETDTVAQHFLTLPGRGYAPARLERVHRTGEPRLLRLFEEARGRALAEAANPRRKLASVRRSVRRHAHGRVKANGAADADTLILYRSRAEVLAEAAARAARAQPFRLRLSGLPTALQPWVAQVLHDRETDFLSRHGFAALWEERIGGDAEPAWKLLCGASGAESAERLDLLRLRRILRLSQPPSELCRFDPGDETGPVIGTIHASKGREMPRVRLMLPLDKAGGDDPDGEARVLFVGATRARARLELGRGMRLASRRLANGRVYLHDGPETARCEIGRPGDFDWMAGWRDTPEPQRIIAGLCAGQKLRLEFAEGVLRLAAGECALAHGTAALLADLRHIRARLAGQEDYRAFALRCGDLPCLGLGTLAFDPRNLPKEAPAPWRRTGLMLAPLAAGLAEITFYPL